MRAYHPMKNKGCFSGTNRLGLPDVLFCFSGGSLKSRYIGKLASCEDSQSGSRPQDAVALDNERNGKFNLCSNEI